MHDVRMRDEMTPDIPRRSPRWAVGSIATVVVVSLLALAIVALHRKGDSGPSTNPATGRATAVQLRPVGSIVTHASPHYAQTQVTCGPRDPCTAEELLRAPRIVLTDAAGLKYRLGPVIVTGDDVASARASSAGGSWGVSIRLTPSASRTFAFVTARMAEYLPPRQIAEIVDGQIVSAPSVEAPVAGGGLQIVGDITEAQARALAARLG